MKVIHPEYRDSKLPCAKASFAAAPFAGAVIALAAALSGCVAEPVQPAYEAPPGVAYVEPTYVSPGPGYVWAYHARYGWGWHHPQYGWHRGWR